MSPSHQRLIAASIHGPSADAALRSLADAVLILDTNRLITEMNPAAETLVGSSIRNIARRPLDSLLQFPDVAYCPALRAIEEYQATESLKIAVLFPSSGKKITAALTVSPILDQHGVAEGVVVLLRDVTQFRRTEEQYQRARHLEGMQRLAEGIAHNLNNLVTVISGYSESLASTLRDSDPQLSEARMIQQTAGRASLLIRQLMLFSRRHPVEPKLLDLNTCFAVMENILRPMLGSDIGLMSSFAKDLHKVEADPRHIEQILMTLVLNAREAMPDGGVISLRTGNVDLGEQLAMNYVDVRAGEYVLLEVSDTGGGMDYATQSHLFEPFFTTKEPRRAMGLGLAALYGMVKQAGGHVAFESEPGRGTRFLVYLPKAEEPRPTDLDSAPLAVPRAGAETVLVVEDDLPMRLLTREVLLQQGYHVLEAASGNQALALLTEHDGPVHLVVSDIMMPGMSGFELAARLENTFPDVKILFISAFSQYALTHHGAVPGATKLLQKPFTAETLIEKVQEALNG